MAIVLAPDIARRLAVGWSVYTALCVALVVLGVRLPPAAAERIPGWLLAIIVSLVGPPLFFIWGVAAWKLFFAASISVALGLACSWLCWRRYPESELFVVGLLVAVAVWAASGWVAVGLGR